MTRLGAELRALSDAAARWRGLIVTAQRGDGAVSWWPFGKKRVEGAPATSRLSKGETSRLGTLVDQQVVWIDSFVKERPFVQTNAAIAPRLAYIQRRRGDRKLYLAVVGEFNSGKSTLINALISDDLLRVGSIPVTANPTHLVYGAKVDIQATFPEAGRLSYRADRRRMLSAVGALRPRITPTGDEMNDLLGALTADATVASAISDCVISHPSAFLRDGVVIIDTPGLNENQQLEAATVTVIKDEADLCLVAIPSAYAKSMTLVNFLSDQLGPMLHRCIFVVTKMDFQDLDDAERASEQARIIAGVTQALERLNLRRPTLYPVEAKAVIDQLKRKELTAEQRRWAVQFDQWRGDLTQRLRTDRQIAVIERLLGLLSNILTSLDKDLAAQQQSLTLQADALKAAGLADFDAFIAGERSTGNSAVSDALTRAKSTLRSQASSIQGQMEVAVKQGLDAVTSIDGLKAYLDKSLPGELAPSDQALNSALANGASVLDSTMLDASKRFELRFDDRFKRLTALAGKAPTQGGAGSGRMALVPTAASPSVTARSIVDQASKMGDISGWGGAIAGAAAGTAIFPGVGTIVGGLLGALVGSWFGPSVATVRGKVWESLHPEIVARFSQSLSDGERLLDARSAALTSAFSQRLNAVVNQYRAVYDQAVAYQQRERARLETSMAAIQRDRADVNTRRATLEAELASARAAAQATRGPQSA